MLFPIFQCGRGVHDCQEVVDLTVAPDVGDGDGVGVFGDSHSAIWRRKMLRNLSRTCLLSIVDVTMAAIECLSRDVSMDDFDY